MSVTTAIILDKRWMNKKTKNYPTCIRVTYQRIPRAFPTGVEMTPKEFEKLSSPRLGEKLREIKEKLDKEGLWLLWRRWLGWRNSGAVWIWMVCWLLCVGWGESGLLGGKDKKAGWGAEGELQGNRHGERLFDLDIPDVPCDDRCLAGKTLSWGDREQVFDRGWEQEVASATMGCRMSPVCCLFPRNLTKAKL